MKTKITLSIAGLLLGLVLSGGALSAYAAEPAVVPASTVMNQTDTASLKASLDTLQGILVQLNSDLKNGRITATNAAAVNIALASTKESLLVLKNTLAVLYPPSENFAKSEISPAPKAQTEVGFNIEPSQNAAAEAAPSENVGGQASLASLLQSKTTVGVILVVVLVAVVTFVLRRKPKTEPQTA